VEAPAFVRCRGQASGEEILFLFAQAADAPNFCEHPGDFFFHWCDVTLGGEGRRGRKRMETDRKNVGSKGDVTAEGV
jgi:hypothetical protein